jgi:N-methylhydantoinase A
LKKEIPHVFLSLSSEVLPEFREYERLSTTVLNAYLGPILTGYLKKLNRELIKIEVDSPLFISQSDGGIISARSAIDLPARTLYSGPGAGIVGASYFYGKRNKYFVSLDMGGTSTDITLITDSKPVKTTDKEINGYPYRFPSIDIATVGAGGGSIAEIDEGGFLQVGPASAGAEPGPACYGKGGVKPTITDANLVLGILGEGTILGGKIKINTSRASAAIKKYISEPLDISLEEGASSILRLAISNIADAVSRISILRGIHPGDLKLIAYGGAGPMHAADLARELGIKEVIIPNNPGVFSALGLLCSDLTMDFVKTVRRMDAKRILTAVKKLKDKGCKWLEEEGVPSRKQKLEWSVDIRYSGQNYEINIPMKKPFLEIKDGHEELAKRFQESHFKVYGHKQEGKDIEIVNLRLRCIGLISVKPTRTCRVGKAVSGKALKEKRTVRFLGYKKPVITPAFNKSLIPLKTKIKGPAILEEVDSTIIIPADDSAFLDNSGDLIIYVNKK